MAGIVLVAALHGIAGVGIGEALRNPALAVGVVFGWAFVVEGVLPVVLRDPDAARWLPTGAIRSALSIGATHEETLLVPWAGLVVLTAYAGGLLLLGLVRAARSDA